MIDLAVSPLIVTPEGKKIDVPVNRAALGELVEIFSGLSPIKQDWLLARFVACDNDEEATQSVVAKGRELPHSTVKGWKQKDGAFMKAYVLLSGRCVDWASIVCMSIEAGNAVLGALANRELLLKDWNDISARMATAKQEASNKSLDRVLGRKSEIEINIRRLEDLVPKR